MSSTQRLSASKMTRKLSILLIAVGFLAASLLSSPSGTNTAHAATTKQTKSVAKTAPKILTKWQKEEILLAKYDKKKSVKVTKANKRIAKLYALHHLDKKYKSNKKRNKQYRCLNKVFNYESSWNWRARSSNGYYGLPQTKSSMRKHGKNWKKHYGPQIKWGFNYMKKRYGSPCGAWKKIKRSGWY